MKFAIGDEVVSKDHFNIKDSLFSGTMTVQSDGTNNSTGIIITLSKTGSRGGFYEDELEFANIYNSPLYKALL